MRNVGVKISLMDHKNQISPLMNLVVVDFTVFVTYGAKGFTATIKNKYECEVHFLRLDFIFFT